MNAMELTFAKRDYQYKSGDGHTHTYTQMEYVVDGPFPRNRWIARSNP